MYDGVRSRTSRGMADGVYTTDLPGGQVGGGWVRSGRDRASPSPFQAPEMPLAVATRSACVPKFAHSLHQGSHFPATFQRQSPQTFDVEGAPLLSRGTPQPDAVDWRMTSVLFLFPAMGGLLYGCVDDERSRHASRAFFAGHQHGVLVERAIDCHA